MPQYVVYDDKGVIHQYSDWEEAYEAFKKDQEFEGDLVFAHILHVRR